MTNIEAAVCLKKWLCSLEGATCYLTEKAYCDECDALKLAIKALESQTEVNVYDNEETYHNCTVQVLTNTVTGHTSVGWWQE